MDIQTLIAAAIVLAAAFFIARRLWRSAHGHSDGACDKCAPGEAKRRG
jgi:hypothetical protein